MGEKNAEKILKAPAAIPKVSECQKIPLKYTKLQKPFPACSSFLTYQKLAILKIGPKKSTKEN